MSESTVKYQEDFTKCSVCLETFTDPRELPCIHSFCLKCLDEWAAKTNPNKEEKPKKLECPLCRKETVVPEAGLAELPRNCFLQQLLDVKQLAAALTETAVPCDVCSDSKAKKVGKKTHGKVKKSTDEEETANAIVYCIECRKKMCENCGGYHEKFNSSHKLIELDGKEQGADELVMLFPESMCDKHKDKNLEIYCMQCNVAVCYMCHIRSHKSHECSDVKDVADDLGKKIKEDNSGIDAKVAECEKMLEKLAADEKQFLEKVSKTDKAILDRCEDMKKVIEDHKSKLIAELDEAKDKQVKEVALVRQEVEGRLRMLQHFKKYSEELREKGKACDVAKAAGAIRARAKDLTVYDVSAYVDAQIKSVDVKFVSPMAVEDSKKVFGQLGIETLEAPYDITKCTEPFKVLPSIGHYVAGVATFAGELFVVRYGLRYIDVYDELTLTPKRQLQLPADYNKAMNVVNDYRDYDEDVVDEAVFTATADYDLFGDYNNELTRNEITRQHRGLALCPVNRCIYVSDEGNYNIYKLTVDNSNVASQWYTGYQVFGLSVNSVHNLLIACYTNNVLLEYTSAGTLVRQISLQTASINYPTHAIELPNGQYGITHQNPYHRYCVVNIVNNSAQLVKSYGNNGGHAEGQLYSPFGLAVDKRGFVFIASQSSNKVVVLDPDTFAAKQLPAELGIAAPYCLHFNETGSRLYVGEWNGRVIVLGRR